MAPPFPGWVCKELKERSRSQTSGDQMHAFWWIFLDLVAPALMRVGFLAPLGAGQSPRPCWHRLRIFSSCRPGRVRPACPVPHRPTRFDRRAWGTGCESTPMVCFSRTAFRKAAWCQLNSDFSHKQSCDFGKPFNSSIFQVSHLWRAH